MGVAERGEGQAEEERGEKSSSLRNPSQVSGRL